MLRWTVHLKGGPKRILHAAVAVGHKMYSFGGYSQGETDVNEIDVLVFNTVSLSWTRLPPAAAVAMTATTTHPEQWTDTHKVPSMLLFHTAVLINDVIYIWGGIENTNTSRETNKVTIYGRISRTLYAFDVGTHAWSRPATMTPGQGAVPEARYGHSACVLGTTMYVFGGYNDQTRSTNGIYTLDTSTMSWASIDAGGGAAPPTPVSQCHSATVIGTSMFVFGGQGDSRSNYDDVRVFDTKSNTWSRVPSARPRPAGRRGHSAFAHNGELYIFGGDGASLRQKHTDLWKFNPDALSWRRVKPMGKDLCWKSRMCCCAVGERIVLFGGYRRRHDELYILDLSPSLKTLCKLEAIRHGLDKEPGLPHDIRWELAAMTGKGNRKRKKKSENEKENKKEGRGRVIPAKRNKRNG